MGKRRRKRRPQDPPPEFNPDENPEENDPAPDPDENPSRADSPAEDDVNGDPDVNPDVAEGLTGSPPDPDDLADNQRDIRADQWEKEATMAERGELPIIRYYCKRETPNFVMHNGHRLDCGNQLWEFEGQYTDEEVRSAVNKYFGGGVIKVQKYNLEKQQVCGRKRYDFPGRPNANVIIDDLYQGVPPWEAIIAPKPGAASPSADANSSEPIDDDERELRELDIEIKKTERRQALERRRARYHELQAEARQREEELAHKERERKEAEKAERRRKVMESGPFVLDEDGNQVPMLPQQRSPYDDLDRPLTARELLDQTKHDREISELKQEHARQIDALRQEIREAVSSKSEGPGMTQIMMQMMAQMQQSSSDMVRAIVESNKGKNDEQQQQFIVLLKTLMDSGKHDRIFETMVQAVGLREDRRSNETANMIKMLELGANLGGGAGGAGDEVWWKELLRGGGDFLGGLASRFAPPSATGASGGAPPRPTSRIPLPGQAEHKVPHPEAYNLAGGAQVPGALPQPPQPRPAIAPQPQAAPEEPQFEGTPIVRVPEQEVQEGVEEGQVVSPEEEMRDTIDAIVEAILDQADDKPASPVWVEVAYQQLPLRSLRLIAGAPNYDVLISECKKYVSLGIGARLKARIETDQEMTPWIVDAFEELKQMAIERISKYPQGEPQPAPEPEDVPELPAAPAPEPSQEDVEPVRERGEGIDDGA